MYLPERHHHLRTWIGILLPALFFGWGVFSAVAQWSWIPYVSRKGDSGLPPGAEIQYPIGAVLHGQGAVAIGLAWIGLAAISHGFSYWGSFEGQERKAQWVMGAGVAIGVTGIAWLIWSALGS